MYLQVSLDVLMMFCVFTGISGCTDDVLCTGRARLIRSHSSVRFCFELSGNSN